MLNVEDLEYIYNLNTPFQTEALHKVSFSVVQGEVIALIGPSGSGKSCLLRCLAGLLTPLSGKVKWDPKIFGTPGLVIQEPEKQFFMDNIFEEVAFALSQARLTPEELANRVKTALDRVGFAGDLTISPFRLSGGQQRRIALASILIMEPQFLMLDEPTVGLDANGLAMLSRIIELYRNQKRTVMVTSHDLDFLYPRVDRFLVLHQGKLVADFKKADFPRQIPFLKQLGITIPERVQLAEREIPEWLRRALYE